MVAGQKILVVDDEPLVTRGCQRILTEAGYDVGVAATGQDGLTRAVSGRFDLVMADLKLPDVDGMEIVRALRRKRPEVAVIVITGYGSVPSAVEAMKLGAADYIEKPFAPEEITDAISRALAGSTAPPPAKIEGALVRKVLRQAEEDPSFSQRLMSEGSACLSGLALSPAAKAAILSGDVAWIERECGCLSDEERAWLFRRLEMEAW